jgi:hypothetical protein
MVLKSKAGLAKPGTNSLKTTISIAIITIILVVGGLGAYVIFKQGSGTSQDQTTVRDSLKINSFPTDTPYIVIPENCSPQYAPYVYADVINQGPSMMTGVTVYINAQPVGWPVYINGQLAGAAGGLNIGPGGVARILAPTPDGINLVPGKTYILTVVGVFADGTSAATSAQVIAGSTFCG